MVQFTDNKFMIIGFVIIVLVLAIFLIDYRIKNVVNYELNRIQKKKMKKMNIMKKRQKIENVENNNPKFEDKNDEIMDVDSYVDPAERFFDQNDQNVQNIQNDQQENICQNGQCRTPRNEIMMRDMIDEIH